MTEREDTIETIERVLSLTRKDRIVVTIPRVTAEWAVSMLKAQEQVEPYMDYDGQDVWRCGNCGATLFHLSHTQADENEQNCVKYCRYCGKSVKWDEPPKEG